MGNRRVRICDIAEELGLSTATVSNVLHGKTGKVSDATIQRVQALLEERQYIPSMAGLLLAQNTSRIIGVVINDHEKYESRVLEDNFIASSLNWLSAELERSGQFMMIKKTTHPEEIIQFASMWNMDGLVLIGFCDQDYVYLRSHMRLPFVVYDGYCDGAAGICNITIDNFDGGLQVGTHLRQMGHTRALCIADNLVCVDKERWEGFRTGFAPGRSEFLMIPMQKAQRHTFYREHLDLFRRHSAIFAVSDFYAIELIQFLAEQSCPVPGEISVVGFDDTPMCELVSPALTTVRQDVALRASIAVQKLRELHGHPVNGTTIRLPVTLVRRASVRALEPS